MHMQYAKIACTLDRAICVESLTAIVTIESHIPLFSYNQLGHDNFKQLISWQVLDIDHRLILIDKLIY